MATLQGVVEEWDNDEGLRQRLRDKGKLFIPAPYKEILEAKVECGEQNFAVLKPLVKRLRNPDGTVGMHTVPDLQYQIFSSKETNKMFMLFASFILKIQFLIFWLKEMFAPTWFSNISWFSLCFEPTCLRIKQLYLKAKLPSPRKCDLKEEAKLAKKFMVLVKRKLQRDQVCRGKLFRKLLALVFDPEELSITIDFKDGVRWCA